jgi:hypothetical protein
MSLDQALYVKDLPRPNLIKLDIEAAEKEPMSQLTRFVAVKPQFLPELHDPECDRAAWTFAETTGCRLWSMNTGRATTREEQVHGTLLAAFPRTKSSGSTGRKPRKIRIALVLRVPP